MSTIELGIIMNGVTGRMGANQHLARSIMEIRKEGGVPLPDGRRIMPAPVLTGRNPHKLEALAEASGGLPWSTDLDALLSDDRYSIYFDAQTTLLRAEYVKKAIAAGKHVYCEKPTARAPGTPWNCTWSRNRRASSTAWCRTNCGCRACSS